MEGIYLSMHIIVLNDVEKLCHHCRVILQLRKLDWTPLEKRERFPGLEHGEVTTVADSIFIPGGGFAESLYLKW